jgi:ring-1,2-phenylacetyl-CoA epoxidase subunit PaaD
MVTRAIPSREELFAILDEVKDPEVPVVSVVELGIVRDVAVTESGVQVTITPTYSGCPAMREIEGDIRDALAAHALGPVDIRVVYSPAWTTDWIGPAAKAKLEAYGIAPPGAVGRDDLVSLQRRSARIHCPYCKSVETERKSEFGSTACKSIWFCRSCRQPFEEFKAI